MTDTKLPPLPVETFKEAAPLLRRPFTPEAVRFKIQTGTLAVAYIDARLVAERLNMVCPQLWSDAYEQSAKGMVCHLTVDGITRTDYGDGYVGKGLFSDAFKRAAIKFGVGVSLYSIPSTWLDDGHIAKNGTINAAGMTFLRGRYATWLTNIGKAAFGEPLDHGDTAESAGDVEALVTPADVDAPTEEQRAEAKALCEELGIEGTEKEMLGVKHGVQTGVKATHKNFEALLTDLRARKDKA
jgi:hypothetical protein